MHVADDRLEELLQKLRRRALRVVSADDAREEEDTIVPPRIVERVERMIAENRWDHLRTDG